MSKLWLLIDTLITAPFFMLGYTVSAAVFTAKFGYHKYIENLAKAEKDKV